MRSPLAVVSTMRMHLTLMLVLTFTTGIVDAVGFLALDRVFTGNMTGNVVILGMALVGADDLPVVGPALALGGFMAGAALGGRVLRTSAATWSHLTTILFGVVASAMLALAALLVVVGDDLDQPISVTVTTILGAAMGLQAAVARRIAVKDVTTVVVTSTITGLAAESVLGNGAARAVGANGRRIWAVTLILFGAAVGAAMLRLHVAAPVALAGLLVAGSGAAGALHARRIDTRL